MSGLTGSPLLRPAGLLASLAGDFYFRAFNGLVTLPVAEYDYGGNWTISTGGAPPPPAGAHPRRPTPPPPFYHPLRAGGEGRPPPAAAGLGAGGGGTDKKNYGGIRLFLPLH